MRFWTTKEVELLSSDMSITDISISINRSVQSVRSAMHRYGARLPEPIVVRKFHAEDIAQMLMLKESGWSWADIASAKSSTEDSVRAVACQAKKYGFDKYPKRTSM